MKTRELIKQIQEADPTGEVEACVGNSDIHFVELLPAYYDGALQMLGRDEDCKFYNIRSGKYVRRGNKVKIHTLSITDALMSNPETFTVDYSQLNDWQLEATKKKHDDLREHCRTMAVQFERDYFRKWVTAQAEKVTADTEEVDAVVNEFFTENVSPNDPYPDGGMPSGHSYVSMREMQWGQRFEVVTDEGFLTIRQREGNE